VTWASVSHVTDGTTSMTRGARDDSPRAGTEASVRVRVPAKINLSLRVGPPRADGYHSLGTIFHAVNLFDEVSAAPAPAGVITLEMSGEGIADVPSDGTNLAVRAAVALREAHGTPDLGVHLGIRKTIPVAGGMAGGSADCAGALLACSVLWDLDTTPDDLYVLAAKLGSDVPFSLHGGTAIGSGRGEELVPLLSRGCYDWVLALADGGLSTPAVFRRFDELGTFSETDIPDAVMNALAAGDPVALGKSLTNDLQAAAVSLRPELQETLDAGLAAGALGGIVSGSGPTCAFLASSLSHSLELASKLEALPHVRAIRRASGPVPGARLVG